MQDTAYGALLRGPRQALHGRIAAAIEAHAPERVEREPEILAYHFVERVMRGAPRFTGARPANRQPASLRTARRSDISAVPWRWSSDRATGLIDRLAGCFTDSRSPEQVEHTVATLVGQRVFGIALGYEDARSRRTAP